MIRDDLSNRLVHLTKGGTEREDLPNFLIIDATQPAQQQRP